MKTLISAVRPTENIHLEIGDGQTGSITLSGRVVKAVESREHLNTYIGVFEDGSKATVLYWKRLCD